MSSLESTLSSMVPEDQLANLQTISLHDLQLDSPLEQKRLLQTCINDGFFYLDFKESTLSSLTSDIDAVFDLSKELFESSPEVKSLFDVDQISPMKINGYKPKGRNVVGNGKKDGFESWVLPRNGLLQLSNDAFPHPPVIADHLRTLRYAVHGLSFAAHTILSSLSTALFIPAGQRLEDFQGLTRPSPDILRLLKYHANPNSNVVSQTPHTDIGSLTFVFSTTPGLQVLPAHIGRSSAYRESDWRYVLPKPGHAIVNIGDCISMMTDGLLKSALHRVGTVPGCDMPERYSLAYLMRPEDQTLLRVLDSPLIPRSLSNVRDVITSGDWIQKKFTALRGKKDVSNQMDQILTMGRGVLV